MYYSEQLFKKLNNIIKEDFYGNLKYGYRHNSNLLAIHKQRSNLCHLNLKLN
jgi:hypothetical protein